MKESLKKFMLKVPKMIRNFLMEEINKDIKSIKEDNKVIHKELVQNSLDTMRIAICSQELPLKERVEIGNKYIAKGGNGAVKVLVHVLEENYEKELKEGI